MASIASALQFVQSTIKDPIKATPESSGIRSAWSQLALGLATAAGTLGIAALAKKTGATLEPAQSVAESDEGGGMPLRPRGGQSAPEPQEPKTAGKPSAPGQKIQNVLVLAGVTVFVFALILWAATRKKAAR